MRETCILLWLYWLKKKNRVTQPAFHGSEARVVPRSVTKFFSEFPSDSLELCRMEEAFAAMQASILELRNLLVDVASRVTAMELARDTAQTGTGPSGSNATPSAGARPGDGPRATDEETRARSGDDGLRARATDQSYRAHNVPIPDHDVDRNRWAHKDKVMMLGIEEYRKSSDWIRFLQQLRMGLDSYYPFITEFAQEMKRSDRQPNAQDLRDIGLKLCLDAGEMSHFLADLWKVLVAKVKGPGCSILTHTLDTQCAGGQIALRAPIAWWELERESEGATWSRKLDLTRQITTPTRARTWSDVPEVLRTFESRIVEYEMVTGSRFDQDLRISGLLNCLPTILEKQVQAQAGLARTYSAYKEYVLNQVAHNRTGTGAPRSPGQTSAPRDVEAAGLTTTTGWYDHEQRWHDGPAYDTDDYHHDDAGDQEHEHEEEAEATTHDAFWVKGSGKGKNGKPGAKGRGKDGKGFPGVCWHCQLPGHRKFECYMYLGGKPGKSGSPKGGKFGKGHGKVNFSYPTGGGKPQWHGKGPHDWSGKGNQDWGWPTYSLEGDYTAPWVEKTAEHWTEPVHADEPVMYTSLFGCVHRACPNPRADFVHPNPWAALDTTDTEDVTPTPISLNDWMPPRAKPLRQRRKPKQSKTLDSLMIDVVRNPEAQSVVYEPGELEWQQVQTFVDSGAARSVCPLTFCDETPVVPSDGSRAGEQFRTASGTRLLNRGDRIIKGAGQNGELLAMRYAVADVAMALDSVSQICDTGAQVLFTKWGGYILGPAGRVDFTRVGDTYVRSTWVKRPKKKASTPKTTTTPTTTDANDTGDSDVVMAAVNKKPTRAFGRLGSRIP